MQNENKQTNWKEKLGDAGMLLPETALNKEVSWEVLQQRLQNRAKRRRVRLYWVAAACLLPLFFVMIPFSFQDKSDGLQPVVHKGITIKTSLLQPDSSQNGSILPVTKVKTTKQIVSKHSTEKVTDIDNVSPLQIPVATDSVLSQEAMIAPHPADSLIATPVFAIQQKKKLPVIHINELSDPVTTIPMIVQNGSRRYFPLQIAHGEVVGKEIKTVRATSFINFKATSPVN